MASWLSSPLRSTPLLTATLLCAGAGWSLVISGCGEHPRAPSAATPAADLPVGPKVEVPAATPATARPAAEAFLNLPHYATEALPGLLSQTGVFADLATLKPTIGLLPYEVNAALWSDRAHKTRWLLVPNSTDERDHHSTISFSPTGEWWFPSGTVAVKHFDLPLDERDPTIVRRLETRILVRGLDGQIFGATYRWRADGSEADLLRTAAHEDIAITARDGTSHTQHWTYPGPADCLTCHNRTAGGLLGITTRQLNRPGADGVNQLVAWSALGLFDPPLATEDLAALPRLVPPDDHSAPLAERVRSYLDANCSHCHRPGAMSFVSYDARFETPLERQNLIHVRPVNDYGIDRVRYIKPNDPWRSMLLVRLQREDTMKMPPLGRNVVDHAAIDLVREWITSMDGPRPLPPPQVQVRGDPAREPVTVTVQHSDHEAELHYTLDGSLPDDDSPRYREPLVLSAPATLRVKAIRDGFSSSIAVLTTIGR